MLIPKIILFCLIIPAVLYLIYVMFANDRATGILDEECSKINYKLDLYGFPYRLKNFSRNDNAPCEVRWSILENAKEGLPSRKVYRLLKKWHKTKDNKYIYQLVADCSKIDKPVKGHFD